MPIIRTKEAPQQSNHLEMILHPDCVCVVQLDRTIKLQLRRQRQIVSVDLTLDEATELAITIIKEVTNAKANPPRRSSRARSGRERRRSV